MTRTCSEPGCDRPVYCKDLCSVHYLSRIGIKAPGMIGVMAPLGGV